MRNLQETLESFLPILILSSKKALLVRESKPLPEFVKLEISRLKQVGSKMFDC